MDFANEIEKIESGMSGDMQNDIPYLMKTLQEYRYTQYYSRVAKQIGKLMYNVLPENTRAEFNSALAGELATIPEIIRDVNILLNNEDYKTALVLIRRTAESIEDIPASKECIYMSFDNSFELCIYKNLYNPGVNVRQTPFEYNVVLRLYGYTLWKLDKIDEAISIMERAVKWNPLSSRCLYELAELYFIKQRFDEYLDVTRHCLKYAYENSYIAASYRNIGDYLMYKKEYDDAAVFFQLSGIFECNESIVERLNFIVGIRGDKPKHMDRKNIEYTAKKYNIQIGANPEIIKLAAEAIEQACDEHDNQKADYCRSILDKLTLNLFDENQQKSV